MALKHPYLNNGINRVAFDRLANYGRDLEQRPGMYRVEWTSSNGHQGYGDWTTYLDAKTWVDSMNECHPDMTHRLGQQIIEREFIELD